MGVWNLETLEAATTRSKRELVLRGVRLKDIIWVEGVRENHLLGYGLVVGLNKSGDALNNSPFTQESLISMLERLGVNVRDKVLSGQNVAAVMVTADLPPFARQGSHVDVRVASIGAAKDLRGGILLVTPLMGADGEVYAVAQGPIATGGFTAEAKSESSITKGVPTNGRIANGGIIEREIKYNFSAQQSLNLTLRNPDFTTAQRIAEVINAFSQQTVAVALDSKTVHLRIPAKYHGEITPYIAQIEQLYVQPDQVARVLIDEQNGLIVMGEHVRIGTVAISHGNLTIKISEAEQVSQPNPFSNTGTTERVARSEISLETGEDRKITVVNGGVSLQDLVNALNALGVSPQDMITILRAIKAAGALQAEIEVL